MGLVEEPVGNRFPHLDPRDAPHDVVEALQMLDVDGRPDIDARCQQFFDILPALGVARSGHIAVRELIDQDQGIAMLRSEGKCAVDIELRQFLVLVTDLFERQSRQARRHDFGVPAAVRLQQTDENRDTLGSSCFAGREHGVGLAHTGRRAKEDLQLATLGLDLVLHDEVQELIWIRALLLAGHRLINETLCLPPAVSMHLHQEVVKIALVEPGRGISR